jgi:predicted nucleic acid-binding protein
MTVVISDTSVLCYLAQAGQLELLKTLYTEVVVPGQVLAECLHARAPSLLRDALSPLPDYLRIAEVHEILGEVCHLDPGEAAAISLACSLGPSVLLLIDEKAGRAAAQAMGITIRGLLGILAEAHRRRLIDFDVVIGTLKPLGFRLSAPLLAAVRRELGIL